MINVIVIGNIEFTKSMIEVMLENATNIVGIITSEKSSWNSDYIDLDEISRLNSIELHRTDDVNGCKTITWIKQKKPDVIFCLGWSRLLADELLKVPVFGVIGYHPSLLPMNRGRHPLIWALALGLDTTGSTFFMIDQGIDSGDIISQSIINIEEDDDAKSLYEKISKEASSQISEIIFNLVNGSLKRVKQDSRMANIWRKRSVEDGKIDWRMSAESIYNLVRALAKPYPGAHFICKQKKYKVWKVCFGNSEASCLEPGKVLEVNNKIISVKCGDGVLKLISVSPELDISAGEYL